MMYVINFINSINDIYFIHNLYVLFLGIWTSTDFASSLVVKEMEQFSLVIVSYSSITFYVILLNYIDVENDWIIMVFLYQVMFINNF